MRGLVQCTICHDIIGAGFITFKRDRPFVHLGEENRFKKHGYRHAIVAHGLPDDNGSLKFFRWYFSKEFKICKVLQNDILNDFLTKYLLTEINFIKEPKLQQRL